MHTTCYVRPTLPCVRASSTPSHVSRLHTPMPWIHCRLYRRVMTVISELGRFAAATEEIKKLCLKHEYECV